MEKWQKDYAREYQRTCGRIIDRFYSRPGGWWYCVEGEHKYGPYRKKQFEGFTKVLSDRPTVMR